MRVPRPMFTSALAIAMAVGVAMVGTQSTGASAAAASTPSHMRSAIGGSIPGTSAGLQSAPAVHVARPQPHVSGVSNITESSNWSG